jgi:hypothetical protein
MKTRKLLVALCLSAAAVFGGYSQAQAATIATDIIMIVDESGSMSNVQSNLRTNIGQFASILSAGGVDARYGLVGYGNTNVVPRMLTNLTSAGGFATAASNLVASGGTEPGYSATAFALNSIDGQSDLFSFRANALKNIILFTDEPSNGDSCTSYGLCVSGVSVTLASADALLTGKNALFNAVLAGTNTINSYKPLADNHGGNVYDLNGLNTTDPNAVQTFVNSFAQSKLQEIVDYCTLHPEDPACQGGTVPEPSSLGMLGFGLAVLAGFAALRRRMI